MKDGGFVDGVGKFNDCKVCVFFLLFSIFGGISVMCFLLDFFGLFFVVLNRDEL